MIWCSSESVCVLVTLPSCCFPDRTDCHLIQIYVCLTGHAVLCHAVPCCGCAVQVIVAESYGGNDEPVDSLVANIVGVGAEVSTGQLQCVCGMHA
jgi:hypothetical protein